MRWILYFGTYPKFVRNSNIPDAYNDGRASAGGPADGPATVDPATGRRKP